MSTFVTLGNMTQPFTRLLRAVEQVAALLPGPIIAQCGYTEFRSQLLEVVRFVPMERFAQLVGTSDVLVMHAGAGSIIHALSAGRAPIVVPRLAAHGEAVDDHQSELARALERQSRVRVAHDADGLRRAVLESEQRAAAAADRESALAERIAQLLRSHASCAP